MAGTLTPTPFQTVLDTDGVAVSGALIYTYVGGTTTAAATYTTSALSVANTNPIVADSGGRFVAYLPAGGNFKFTYKTAAGATIEEQDNILSVPGAAVNLDIEGTVGQAVTAGQVCYLSSGAEATPLTPGLWYLTDADAAATSTLPQSIGFAVSAIAINTAGTIRLAGTATTASAVVVGSTYYVSATSGAITATAPALPRQVGVALTTSTLLLAATTAVSVLPNPINQDVLFVDATYDIGKAGANRPRDFFQSRNATIGGTLGVVGAATVATLGVTGATTLSSTVATGALTVTGAATVSTTLGVTGATTLSSATYSTFLKSTTAFATPGALTATQATAFASTVSGAAIMGFGTTNDVSLMNRAGTVVLGIGPNTTAVNMAGTLSVGAVTSTTTANNTLTVERTSGARMDFVATSSAGYIGTYTNHELNFRTNNAVVATLSAAGLLTVSGNSATYGLAFDGTNGGGIAATHASGAIRFYSGGTTERAQFTTTGSFLINTTTALAKFVLSAPMQAIDGFSLVDTSTAFSPNIYIHFYNSSLTVAGSIAHPSASAVTFNTSSDQRLKRDLGLARDVSALRALRIHDFSWTSDGVIDRNVFAQEAYAVMPRGITKGDDDPVTVTKTWMVEKAAYVPDLIVGWQQHDATITQLAARIAALESQDN